MSQKIKTSVEIDGSLKASQIANATTDTDKFLVSDDGTIKYRTGAEMLSDLGVSLGTASKIQHQVKAGVAINKGQAVYVTSADGTNMIVGLASNVAESSSSKTMGLLNATVSANGFADVIAEGLLSGLDTSTAIVGNPVWLGTNGNLIYGLANKPSAPSHLVFIGIVTRVNANNGEIFVKVQNGFELDELHDVDLKSTTPSGNDILAYEGAPVNLWKNKSIAAVLGYTPYNASNPAGYISTYTETDTLASVTSRGATTSTLSTFDGGLNIGNTKLRWGGSSTPTLGLPFSGSTNAFWIDVNDGDTGGLMIDNEGVTVYGAGDNGYVFRVIDEDVYQATSNVASSTTFQVSQGQNGGGFIKGNFDISGTLTASGYNKTNWDTAFGWGNHASAGYVPSARTITINGTSYDLSANRSWTVTASETDTLATVVARGDITNGGRPIRLDTSGGGVSIRGSAGGWATGYYFMGGTSNTYRGGFGALGENDGLTNYWIGPAYNNFYTYIDASQITHTSSMRAPIFYDSNNTGYYVDPASTSSLNVLSMANKIIVGSFPNSTVNNGEAWIGRAADRSAGTMTVQLGGNLDRKFEVVDYGWTTVNFSVNGYGAAEASGSMRAPIFYDSNDTSYYLDPNSTSRLLAVNAPSGFTSVGNPWGTANSAYFPNGITTAGSDNWIYGHTYIGNAPANGNGHEFWANGEMVSTNSHQATIYYDRNNTGYYTDPASTSNLNGLNIQGLLQVAGTTGNYNEGIRLVSGTGSWSNIQFGANMTGVGTQANQWIVGKRPDGNFVMSLAGNQDGGSRFLIQQDGRVQSPVYYDGNDTNYYVDPNGSSNMDTINAARFASRMGSQNPDSSHPGFGIRPFYSWNLGQAGNATAGYSNGISIGSHPGDQSYGFQIVQNMWDDQLYFRRYNGGWQGWRTALDNSNYSGYSNFGANSVYGGIFYDGHNTGYYVNPDGTSNMVNISAGGYIYAASYLETSGPVYGTIFYDNNNRAYYMDPNGTSRMGTINSDLLRSYSNLYLDSDYGRTVVGVYSSYRFQGVFAMGDSYKLATDGTSCADHYGIAWSHPNAGGQAANLSSHGALIQISGITRVALSTNIWCQGDIIAYSDARVKDNVQVIDNPLERLKKVRGVTFTRNDLEDKEKRYAGVIAQEMIEALPEVVTENADGHLSVSYGNSVSLLIECIKEQQTQIEELKELVNKLINK